MFEFFLSNTNRYTAAQLHSAGRCLQERGLSCKLDVEAVLWGFATEHFQFVYMQLRCFYCLVSAVCFTQLE